MLGVTRANTLLFVHVLQSYVKFEKLLELILLKWSFPMQSPAANAAPVAKAEAIPIVTISYALTDLTVDAFTDDLKGDLVAAIVASLPKTSNVDVYLTNIRAASVLFDTVVRFLDGDDGVAQALSDSVAASATVSFLFAASASPTTLVGV